MTEIFKLGSKKQLKKVSFFSFRDTFSPLKLQQISLLSITQSDV